MGALVLVALEEPNVSLAELESKLAAGITGVVSSRHRRPALITLRSDLQGCG